ncbi:uncharacterized protein KQ657_002713 [Scheffersomyces spartinae]|uniref:Uncharacterized protein n=1 Tax=Scheffersomyces spartinae TaxID=45513 RepID=A0A9P7V655_9ASCO|nr:uncharacterized protein KQ657_002713 [Scheffersomyces spartinae]KAG7191923.1 hypothetical protein KQ657_002713 [Scheffersomyces spartinae]
MASASNTTNLVEAFYRGTEKTHKKSKDIDFHVGTGVFFDLDKKRVTIDAEEETKKKKLKMKLKKILSEYDDDDDDCDDGKKFFGIFGHNGLLSVNDSSVQMMGGVSALNQLVDGEEKIEDFEKNNGIRIGSGFYFDLTLDKDKGDLEKENEQLPMVPTSPRPPPPGYYSNRRPLSDDGCENDNDSDSDEDEDDLKRYSNKKSKKIWFWPFSVDVQHSKNDTNKVQISSTYLLSHAKETTSNLFTTKSTSSNVTATITNKGHLEQDYEEEDHDYTSGGSMNHYPGLYAVTIMILTTAAIIYYYN